MKRVAILMFSLLGLLMLTACSVSDQHGTTAYISISAQEAKTLMDENPDAAILDTRTQDEYDAGHIKHAMLIPHDAIAAEAPEKLPDKEQLILVYCRTGRRSKIASQALVDMGYTNVREFGGINDWPYGVE